MANTKRIVVGMVVLSATFVSANRSAEAQAAERPVVLHVENHAHVTPEMLAHALRPAASIYAAAGIRMIWVEGDPATARDASALHLRLLLLSREMSDTKIDADQVGDKVMGQAANSAGRAYIFYHRILEFAREKRTPASELLGKVIAHELGHMLGLRHSERGIMQAEPDLRAGVRQGFTESQAVAMWGELLLAASKLDRPEPLFANGESRANPFVLPSGGEASR